VNPESVGLAAAARRNVFVLAGGLAALYAMVELVFGVATITFEDTGGSKSLGGIAPAIFLLAAAIAALVAGQAMDRSGRRPVLAVGFAAGTAGCLLAALGTAADLLFPAILGFALTGAATGTVLLSRAAAADMFPPERRPRAIAQVLFGAVFGALLGPLVFGPLLGEDSGGSALDLAWLGGAGFMVVGLVLALRLRPDPREIARAVGGEAPSGLAPPLGSVPLRTAAFAPGVPPALLAVLGCWAGMVTLMSLVGAALIDHGREHGAVFPVLAAHFVGMFGFFAIVGPVIERIGRPRAIVAGLLLIGASCLAVIPAIDQIHLVALILFAIGLGWSLSFVAATAELSERAPRGQSATLIGLSDLIGSGTAAALVAAGGFTLDEIGIASVGIGAAVLPLLAAVWISVAALRPASGVAEAG
jgi:MFS family permease